MPFHSDFTSITEPSRAIKLFTDRMKETRYFVTFFHNHPTPNKVIYFWGNGGNGKSLFLNYLRKYFCKFVENPTDWEYLHSLDDEDFVSNFKHMDEGYCVPTSFLDFGLESQNYRNQFFALLELRRNLTNCGLSFPLFDYACFLYLYKTNKLEKQKDLLPKETLDLATELVSSVIEHASIVKTAKAAFNLFNKHLGKDILLRLKEMKVDDDFIVRLSEMDPDRELIYRLPNYFALDLNKSMESKKAPKRVILFFDTHEAFWGKERNLANHLYFERDEWLRKLLGLFDLTKGIIVVVAGREVPRWSETDMDYSIPLKNIDSQLIGQFSKSDARNYLAIAGINETSIQDSLVNLALIEENQVHPFYLGLCADIFLQANAHGNRLTSSEIDQWFEEKRNNLGQKLLNRLLRYTETDDMESCIQALSACRTFNYEIYKEICLNLNLVASKPQFETLCRFSFITKVETSEKTVYKMHELLRKLLKESASKVTVEACLVLKAYYQDKAQDGDVTAVSEAIYYTNQVNWEEGVTKWVNAFEDAFREMNIHFCSLLVDSSFDLNVRPGFYSGEIPYCRGRYFHLVSEFKQALENFEKAIQEFDNVLVDEPENIYVHNNKGMTLIDLGELQSTLTQRDQALECYTLAIEAFDKVIKLKPEFTHAYNNKGSALLGLGDVQSKLCKHDHAKESYTQAIEICNKALNWKTDHIDAHGNKATALLRLGDLQVKLNLNDQALERYVEAIDTFDEILSLVPKDVFLLNNRCCALQSLGDLQTKLEQYEQSQLSYSNAIESYDETLKIAPESLITKRNKALALFSLGELHAKTEQYDYAQKSYLSAIEIYDEVLDRVPEDFDSLSSKGDSFQRLGNSQSELHKYDQALETYTRAVEAYDEASDSLTYYSVSQNNKGATFASIGDVLAKLKRRKQALESYVQASEILDSLLEKNDNRLLENVNMDIVKINKEKIVQKILDLKRGLYNE